MRFWEQPRQPVIGLSICAAMGIECADFFPVAPLPLVFALVIFAAAMLRWRSTVAVCVFVCASFFALHTLNFHHNAGEALAREFTSNPQVVRVTGIVLTEPEERPASRGVARCD